MAAPTQDNRLIRLNIPALEDKDKLLLTAFTGQEGLSFSFHYDLQLLSTDPAISFEEVVGSEATITIALPDNNERIINGIISAFSQGGHAGDFTAYQATLTSQMWLLTRVADCRIFQNKTVPQIVRLVLDKNQIQHVVENLEHDRYQPREYCVQYSETDFHFISRLMEEEGIFYYFEHVAGTKAEGKDRHILVIADSISSSHTVPFFPEAEFVSSHNKEVQNQGIYAWSMTQEIRPDKYTLRDFDFKKAGVLTDEAKTPGVKKPKREIYDFPGNYETFDRGQQLADLRIEEIETANLIVAGSGACRAFASGFLFKLKGHYRKDVNRDYLLTTIFHSFSQGDDFCSTRDAVGQVFSYTNNFSCIPAERRFRPPRTTQVPVIAGAQTAIVVGANTTDPQGNPPPKTPPHQLQDQIYTDEFGRVKVRFHWDRARENGDTTCFLRVAQPWASAGWGHQWIPRIGEEVVVTFFEADPDRPVITGAVYDGANHLPFTTDRYKTQSGIRTRTNPIDPDGPNDRFNMMRFDDKRDCEQVFLRSQKRMDVRALASYYDTCGGDRNTLIGGKDDKGHQGGDYTLTVGNDTDIHINGACYQKIEKKFELAVVSDVICDFEANHSVLVATKSELNAKQIVLEGLQKISLKVGGSFLLIDSSGVTISGPSVKINSGGAGTPCGSPDIDDPLDAAPADTGKPGFVDCSKGGGGGGRKRHTRTLNAQHAAPFATTRLPDGSIKVGNNITIKPNPADPSFQDKALRDLTTMSNAPAGMDNLNAINDQSHPVTIQYGPVPSTPYDSPQDGTAKGKPAYDGTTGTGNGTGSTIQYDPDMVVPTTADPTVNVPPDVILNHEMSHSKHAADGSSDFSPDTTTPNNGNLEEAHAIADENAYRSQRTLPDGRTVPPRKDHTTT